MGTVRKTSGRRTGLLLGLIAGAALVAWSGRRRPRRHRRSRAILRGLVATLGSTGTAAILYEAALLLLRALNRPDEEPELDEAPVSQGAPSDSATL